MDRLEGLLKYMELLSRSNHIPDSTLYRRMNLVANEIEKELGIKEPVCGTANVTVH